MQPIHRELIALMPYAVERPSQGQMVIRELDTWHDHEAARVTLERFGQKAIAYHIAPDHVMFIRPGGIKQPAQAAIHIEFDAEIGRTAVQFYNDLPEDMSGWRSRNAAPSIQNAFASPPAQGPTANMQVGYEDFIEALRRNEVRLLLKNGQIDRYRDRSPNRWSVPVYDFGGLIQPSMAEFLGDDLIDRLLEEAPINPEPPASACVLIQQFKIDDQFDPDQTGLATHLLRVEGLTQTGEPNVTFAAHHQTHWIGASGEYLPGHWRTMAPKDQSPDLTHWHLRWATELIAMLAGWRDDIEFREASPLLLAKVNSKRKLARQTPIPPTKVIHISRQRIQYLRSAARAGVRSPSRGGSHASPHEHTRTICTHEVSYTRNGKEVRYHFKKAGQKVIVKPRLAANPKAKNHDLAPTYQVVR